MFNKTDSRAIIINGCPASGKTYTANLLSKKLDIPVISKDFFKESLFDSLGYSDATHSFFQKQSPFGTLAQRAVRRQAQGNAHQDSDRQFSMAIGKASYELLLKTARLLTEQKCSFMIENAFFFGSEDEILDSLDCHKIIQVWCYAPTHINRTFC